MFVDGEDRYRQRYMIDDHLGGSNRSCYTLEADIDNNIEFSIEDKNELSDTTSECLEIALLYCTVA